MNIELKHGIASLDAEDYESLLGISGFRLYSVKAYPGLFYAFIGGRGVTEYRLHRFVMQAQKGDVVIHLNGNGLDCRKANLKISSHADNSRSFRKRCSEFASKYRGVFRNKGRGPKWVACVRKNGKCYYCGHHHNEAEAALARDLTALKVFGPIAQLNFPLKQTQ